MTLKAQTIFFSSLALTVLIASITIFQAYRSTNHRLYQTITMLDRVNHAGHEIAIDILLDVTDVDSLRETLKEIPLITRQLQEILPDGIKPAELINLEISFIRLKRVVDNIRPGQPVAQPLSEQVRNEIIKISANVAALKNLSERESHKLQARAEIMIMALFIVLVGYIAGVSFFLFRMVIAPVLLLSSQIGKVREGQLEKVVLPPRNDELGELAEEFNRLIDRRRQTAAELKQEITEHKQALDKVKLLSGFLPICASCKQIRDDRGYWNQIETYIRDNSEVEFTHSICPECTKKLYPEYRKKNNGRQEGGFF